MNNLQYGVDLLGIQIDATKDFFKSVLGKDYVPYRSKPMSFEKKQDNNKVVNSWWSKNGHKVDQFYKLEIQYHCLTIHFSSNLKIIGERVEQNILEVMLT